MVRGDPPVVGNLDERGDDRDHDDPDRADVTVEEDVREEEVEKPRDEEDGTGISSRAPGWMSSKASRMMPTMTRAMPIVGSAALTFLAEGE